MVRAFLYITLCLLRADTGTGGSPPHRGDLPVTARGGAWTLEESAQTYAGEELFGFIDGGAPLYFEYGFVLVRAARYRSVSGHVVAAEVYDMRTEAGAYGLFSYLSAGTGTPLNVGQGAVEGSGFLLSWVGKQLWSFTALDGAPGDSLFALASDLVVPAVARQTPAPILGRFAGLFPEARDPVLFFGPLGFQKRASFSPDRSMGIGAGISALVGENEVVLLDYASAREAGVRYDSLRSRLGPAVDGDPPGRGWGVYLRDGRELLVGRRGEYVVILAGSGRERLLVLWDRLQAAWEAGGR